MRLHPAHLERLGQTELVFAYGSNLSPVQMAKRCPSWGFVARARLPGHALFFAGHSVVWGGSVATFREAPRAGVHGIVFRVSVADLFRLDTFEGSPLVYERLRVRVRTPIAPKLMPVHTYRLLRGAEEPGLPSAEYLATIARGYQAWGFRRADLAKAAYRGDGEKSLRL